MIESKHQNMNRIPIANDICEDEWVEWYQMTPAQRWKESQKLWSFYLEVGGALDPEPDTQSPFYTTVAPRSVPLDRRPGLRVLRRIRV